MPSMAPLIGALPKLRQMAESLMTDQCVVTRPGATTTDPDTGLTATGKEKVYEGSCKVQTSGGLASEQTEGSAARGRLHRQRSWRRLQPAAQSRWSGLCTCIFHTALQAFAPVTWWKSRNPLIRYSRAGGSVSSPRNRRRRTPQPAVGT